MAKNFPYFKFTATEWLTGDIVFESLELQGLFINVCAVYWQRDGKLTIEDLIKRYKNQSLINQLIDKYIFNNNGSIIIKFLDEQLIEANHISKVNSNNGKKGAESKRNKATAKRTLNDSKANLSKEEKEEEKEKELELNNNKKQYLDCVFLTDLEYHRLHNEFDEHEVKWMINKLNNYKMSNNKKYANDYNVLIDWVHQRMKEHKAEFIKQNNTAEVRIATALKSIENINWDDYTKKR